MYEVYIVNAIDDAAADAYDELDEKMQSNATFKERLEASRGFHCKVRHLCIISFSLMFKCFRLYEDSLGFEFIVCDRKYYPDMVHMKRILFDSCQCESGLEW